MSIIILKSAPAIAPRGKHKGIFIDAKQEAGTDKFGAAFNNIWVSTELEAKDKTGKAMVVKKSYNLLGRGVSAFAKDFQSWSLRKMTQDELEGFDPDSLIKGQKVIVEIEHRKVGTDLVPVIVAFHPADATVPVEA